MNTFSKTFRRLPIEPTQAFLAEDFLPEEHYRAVEGLYESLLAKEFSDQRQHGYFFKSAARADKDSPFYSAYTCVFGTSLPEPFKVFASFEFRDWVAQVTNIPLNDDFTFSLHYHPPHSPSGWIHNDYELVNYRKNTCDTDLNLLSNDFVSQGPPLRENGFYSVVRAVALLFYLDDGHWQPGDGGETNFYDSNLRRIACFEPRRNSLGFFVVTPESMHAFAGNNLRGRRTLAMWLHACQHERFKKLRHLPLNATFDDVITFDSQVDPPKIEQLHENLQATLASKGIAVNQRSIKMAQQGAQLTLRWGLPYEIAAAHYAITIQELRPNLLFEPEILTLFDAESLRLARYHETTDLQSLWKCARLDEHFGVIHHKSSQKSVRLGRQEIMALMALNVSRFVVLRAYQRIPYTIADRIRYAADYLGPKLSQRMLEAVTVERRIQPQPVRKHERALITGVTSGLGKEVLRNLVAKGIDCWVVVRAAAQLDSLMENWQGRIHPIEVDLADPTSLEEKLNKLNFPSIDLFVHCAALCEDQRVSTLELSAELWQREIAVNTISPYFLMRKVISSQRPGSQGVFVLITSHHGLTKYASTKGLPAYRTSKAALHMLSASFAGDFPDQIFFCVAPGIFKSRMNPQAPEIADHIASKVLSLSERCLQVHSGRVYDADGIALD